LPALLRRNSREFGDARVAIREKEFGIWQSVTWRGYFENVETFAFGLSELGFQAGDKLAIIGDNRPEWIYSELAAQSLGGAMVGIFPDSHLEQVKYIIDHSDAKFIVAEDQEQTDKVLEIKKDLPKIERVIVDDMKGMRIYDDPLLTPFDKVREMGRSVRREKPELVKKSIDSLDEERVAMIAYTSGTTGLPKGAMLSHRNMLKMAENYNQIDPAYPSDNHVSFLPLPWVGEQMTAVAWNLYAGFTVNFPEKVETVPHDIREIGPNILFAPPRFWERMCSDIQVKIQDAAWIKRLFYKFCMPIGYRIAAIRLSNQEPDLFRRFLGFAAHYLMFRSLKNYLGLANLRNVYTGGAALGPDVFNLFQALGVNIKQIYGQTETSGISVGHRNGDIKPDTVGKPIPEVEIKISDTGEILTRGPTVFMGYYKNDEATRDALRDGWLHSGDQGLIDEDGHLVMVDRMKDVMELADGSKFSPQFIENKLKFSMYISEAVIVGQNRPFVAAMIIMDMGNAGKWAENNRITYTTFTDLSQKPQVYDLIADEISRINSSLPRVAQIARFVMMYKELDADDDEMTRTRKVRRSFVAQRYQQLVDALYGDREKVELESDIRYRDGSGYRMKTSVTVKDLRAGS